MQERLVGHDGVIVQDVKEKSTHITKLINFSD